MITWLLLLGFLNQGETNEITNPVKTGPATMVFTEDLRFGGAEEEDEYLWVDAQISVRFDVDGRGHFFVLDMKNSRILEFDKSGKYLGEFAKKGEGPGEYQNLFGFEIFEDGRAVGFDFLQGTGKFTYYDSQLKNPDTKTVHGVNNVFYLTDFDPKGNWLYAWCFTVDTATNSTIFKTALFDKDLQLERELSSSPWPTFNPNRFSEGNYWVDYLAEQFDGLYNRGADFARFLSDGRVVIANSKKYEIEIWSPDLKRLERRVIKQYEPIPFTEVEEQALVDMIEEVIFEQIPAAQNIVTANVIRRAVEKANLPKLQNPINDIVAMPDGAFMVLHEVDMRNGRFTADMFDASGKCVGRVKSPGAGIYDLFGTRLIFKNDHAYAMEKSEEGDNQLVRYRYKLVK